jgi:NAD(P)-dependent dehydrogenase (short-subunit alcohol dehydrogenase family)
LLLLGGLVGLPGAAYHGTKHGVIGLTKSATLDVAAQGIRVNAICPGCIETPMGEGIDPAAMKEFLKEQPIGRMGKPEEIAAVVVQSIVFPGHGRSSSCRRRFRRSLMKMKIMEIKSSGSQPSEKCTDGTS